MRKQTTMIKRPEKKLNLKSNIYRDKSPIAFGSLSNVLESQFHNQNQSGEKKYQPVCCPNCKYLFRIKNPEIKDQIEEYSKQFSLSDRYYQNFRKLRNAYTQTENFPTNIKTSSKFESINRQDIQHIQSESYYPSSSRKKINSKYNSKFDKNSRSKSPIFSHIYNNNNRYDYNQLKSSLISRPNKQFPIKQAYLYDASNISDISGQQRLSTTKKSKIDNQQTPRASQSTKRKQQNQKTPMNTFQQYSIYIDENQNSSHRKQTKSISHKDQPTKQPKQLNEKLISELYNRILFQSEIMEIINYQIENMKQQSEDHKPAYYKMLLYQFQDAQSINKSNKNTRMP